MDTIMPRDYLTQLLANMQNQLDRLESKQDQQMSQLEEIKLQTQKTNGRVTSLEKIVALMQRKHILRAALADPKILYLVALSFVILLAIVAAITKVKIPGL